MAAAHIFSPEFQLLPSQPPVCLPASPGDPPCAEERGRFRCHPSDQPHHGPLCWRGRLLPCPHRLHLHGAYLRTRDQPLPEKSSRPLALPTLEGFNGAIKAPLTRLT